MRFAILSHAGLYVEHNGCSIVIDPWIVGSAYWRSWWNFPEPTVPAEALKPDYIYLTHIHWDHFHGASLRKFSPETKLLIPNDRYDRMLRDLHALGFANVQEIPDGYPFRLGEEFALTPYLFGPFTDSAVVLSSRRATLLNANDCKIVGLPLRRLLRAHPKIDFVLRSHSSANARLSHEYLDAPNEKLDDRERYMRSFCHFMEAVKPRYAVPFASNHCHLHRETVRFNDWIVSPLDVKDYFDKYKLSARFDTDLRIMLPGSRWDDTSGFAPESTEMFHNRRQLIADYQQRQADTLAAYYAKEERTEVTDKDMEGFFLPFLASLGLLFRYPFKGRPIYIRASNRRGSRSWRIDLWDRTVAACEEGESLAGSMQITYPAIVLRQCLKMNMFSHAGISKRGRYQALKREMTRLILFEHYLKMREYEALPLRGLLLRRSLSCWLRRWRELVLYGQVIYLRWIRKVSMEDLEQKLLLS